MRRSFGRALPDLTAATSVKVGYRQAVIPRKARSVIAAGFFHCLARNRSVRRSGHTLFPSEKMSDTDPQLLVNWFCFGRLS
ncbi:hypothetical protein [Massilia sp. METH4]|uniref:hypothetical protein n=1 Tax=Massilia sp. METH4 TaxID=3123041 RepID=UPI0030D0128A